MAIRAGTVVKILEGRGTVLAMIEAMKSSGGRKKGFRFSFVEEGGLRRTAFDPDDSGVIETAEAILIGGREFGSDTPAKLLIFKNEQLNSEVGSLVIT